MRNQSTMKLGDMLSMFGMEMMFSRPDPLPVYKNRRGDNSPRGVKARRDRKRKSNHKRSGR